MAVYTRIDASVPIDEPPAWAVMQRHLFELMEGSMQPFVDKYTHPDGRLIWRQGLHNSRDGADDFYESFCNWPTLYALGGGDRCLELGDRQWDATTRLMEEIGHVYKEYEIGYDQFHQSESYIYFYALCMADPNNPKQIDRARRFAGFYLNEDPEAQNYDFDQRVIRAPHNGSKGPAPREDGSSYGYSPDMAPYGLPYEDVEGVADMEDLKEPELARRMGAAMDERMSMGDVPANLGVVSLVTNAWLVTGDDKYREWVLDYVGAWVERAQQNEGLPPDTIGPNGEVGEYIDGKWYGGMYGWTWPHGFYNIGMACTVAASCAYLISGEEGYLDLPRVLIDRMMDLGEQRKPNAKKMSLYHHWHGDFTAMGRRRRSFMVPHRHADSGWFDYQPMMVNLPMALWNITGADQDRGRVDDIRDVESVDWTHYTATHGKEDIGHEKPWHAYLTGSNPGYPEQALQGALSQVYRRVQLIREDQTDPRHNHIHWWQQLNPVTTETLVQLTLGAPQIIYNGGLLLSPIRHFDGVNKRPGLPPDVSALVHGVRSDRVDLELVNLNAWEDRTAVVQAGSLGEHRFSSLKYERLTSAYPGPVGANQADPVKTKTARAGVTGRAVEINLPAGSRIRVKLGLKRGAGTPSYRAPWED